MNAVTPKAKLLILHAGLSKTATTSIQDTLFKYRGVLFEREGIYYPGDAANHTIALCTAFQEDPRNLCVNKAAGLTDLSQLKKKAADIRQGFEQEIARARPERILFSAEGMSNLNAQGLRDFKDWASTLADEIAVLYITRDPLRYTTSVIQQRLKGGAVLEDMYSNPPLPNFKGRMGNAIRVFGREHITVKTFEDMVAHPDGVVGFFLDQLGVAAGATRDLLVANQEFKNESLSLEAALILSSLNRQRPAFIDGQRAPMRTLKELGMIGQIKGNRFSLPDDVRAKVAQLCADDVAWLRENFGITTYDQAPALAASAPVSQLSERAIDSMALLLSDLINDRHVNTLIQRAQLLKYVAGKEKIKGLIEEIQRITPNRALPNFLKRHVEK